ncbi:MAG: DUF5615 family PIN-like protein [Deltaproteobacteria bacterium]|nr:DUF5615 family PIN-like protein [Deltaproteobacteria bacterium]
MRVLIDENVHVKVISWLKEKGCDVLRVPSGTKNGNVIKLAQNESRVLMTNDTNFSNRFLYPPKQFHGIIILKIHPPKLENLLSALQKLLKEFPELDLRGKLVILEEEGCRLII